MLVPEMNDFDTALERARRRRTLPSPERRRLLRLSAGLSQADIARACGVTRASVSRWESGERCPTGTRIDSYVAVLDRLAREVAA